MTLPVGRNGSTGSRTGVLDTLCCRAASVACVYVYAVVVVVVYVFAFLFVCLSTSFSTCLCSLCQP